MKALFTLTTTLYLLAIPATAAEKIKTLIVDGQNNHAVWPKSTIMMKQYLEESGLFEVDIERTKFLWKHEREESWLKYAGTGEWEGHKKPKADPDFNPDFSKYDLVVSNFGYNAATGEFTDMIEAGILDPTKVTRSALQNAASIAGLMITTEAMIAELPKD